MKRIVLSLYLLALGSTLFAQNSLLAQQSATRHGPEKGALLIIGGSVGETASIWTKFVQLAGGKDKANIVVVTTAAGDSAAWSPKHVEEIRKITGVRNIHHLHSSSPEEANTEKFIQPLKEATAVYFIGGRQWRLADSYLNTRTHKAFLEVLARGGVLAGSSAGASIQGSLLWRGDTSSADVLLGDHTQGLAFLKNSVIDQHLLKRNRQFDLVDVVRDTPKLIGIGLDEATAVVVQGDTLEVIGNSYVAIYDYDTIHSNARPFFFLSHGQAYDLKNRKVLSSSSRQTATRNTQDFDQL